MTGTGLAYTTVALSATTLSFGSVEIGGSSASQSVTLTNTGARSLTGVGVLVSGTGASSYSFVNNCGASLAAGAACTIHGHFAPTSTGSLPATITIYGNTASGPTQTIALGGTGVAGATTLSLSATSFAFGTVSVGSVSGTQTVTLTNTGTSTALISGITLGGPNATSFAIGNSCGSTIAASNSCTIHGHFAPTTTGPLQATITITDSASGSPQTITLSGIGQ